MLRNRDVYPGSEFYSSRILHSPVGEEGAALAYLVPGEKSGGGEGEAGVLHSPVGEGGGQH